MARIERVRVFPIKSLDGVDLDEVRLTAVGGLAADRRWAIRDRAGEFVNGKRTDAVHRLEVEYDLGEPSVTVGTVGDDDRRSFDLEREADALTTWLSAYFGYPVELSDATGGVQTDSRALGGGVAGATVVSTATLSTVASWFPGIDLDGARRRFRANLEVGGVEPFWEDRLVGGDAPTLAVGDVTVRGEKPVPRCVVPSRDPDTGERTPGFRERFVERRRSSFPAWVDSSAFDHHYALTTLVHPLDGNRGERIGVGDDVSLVR